MASNFYRSLPQLRIRFDEAAMRRAEADLAGIRSGMPRAVAGAINKLLPKVRTRVTNELRDVLTVKPNNIRNRITTSKSHAQKLSGSVNILQRRIGLINFKHKENRKKKGWGTKASGTGVEVQLYKGGPKQRFRHAFIAKGNSDNRHIFQRERRFGGRAAPRLPIVRLQGVSLMTEYEDRRDMQSRVRDYINGETGKELDSQVNRLLSRARSAAAK